MESSLSDDDASSSGEGGEETQADTAGDSQTRISSHAATDSERAAGDGDNNTFGPGQQLGEGPRSRDVLLGRGRPYQSFSGNKRMLRIVSQYKEEYIARPRDQKRAFVETVLDVVLKDGTKFLHRVEDESNGSFHWEEVDRLAAAEKVWHALRCKDRPKQRRAKRKADDAEEARSPLPATGTITNHEQTQSLPNTHFAGNNNIANAGDSNSTISSQTMHMLQLATTANTMTNAQALVRDIQLYLSNATAAANLLASVVTALPTTGRRMGNHAVPSSSAPISAQQYAQPMVGNHALPTQLSIDTVTAGLLSYDFLRGGAQGASSALQEQGAQQPFPSTSYTTNMAGLASPPFANPAGHLPGPAVDLSGAPLASIQAQQQNNPPNNQQHPTQQPSHPTSPPPQPAGSRPSAQFFDAGCSARRGFFVASLTTHMQQSNVLSIVAFSRTTARGKTVATFLSCY